MTDAQRQMRAAWTTLLSSPEGRLALWAVIDQTGFLKPSCIVRGESQFASGTETFWREGRRSIGAWLITQLNDVNPHAFAVLVEESAKEVADERATARATHQQRPPKQSEDEDDGGN